MHYVAGKYAGLVGSVLQMNEMGETLVVPTLFIELFHWSFQIHLSLGP